MIRSKTGNVIPTDVTPPEGVLAPSLDKKIEPVAQQLRASLGDLVETVAGPSVRPARLARLLNLGSLASIITVLDPDVIVLGGGVSKIDRLYMNVPQIWTPYIFSDVVATRLVKAMHRDSSGVGGAAWLWPPD